MVGHELPVFRKTVFASLLLIAVALVYGGFLQNPIVFDDIYFFLSFEQSLEHYLGFHPLEIRWLPNCTIAWTAHNIGLQVVWFRVEGLLLHAATGIALFFFLDRLFGRVMKKETAQMASLPYRWVAFFCALFFVWHPVAVYGAGYLIERTIVMATLFSLLALYAYLHGLSEGRPRWLWVSGALYFLAVMSKELAIMLPATMLALTLLLEQPSSNLLRRLWKLYAVCALIALYVFLIRLGMLGTTYEIAAPEMLEKISVVNAFPLSILTQCFLFFKYWMLWLLPNPAWMSVDMRESFAPTIFSPYLFALLMFLGYGAVAFKLLLKRGALGLLGFGLLFPWLLFATEFAAVRIQESFVLYRSYLWMTGSFAVLPFLLTRLRSKAAFAGMLFCALVLAMLSVNRLTIFSSPYMLWDDAEALVRDKQDLPGVARIYYNRGKSLSDLKHYQEALADHQRAVALDPADVNNHYALGTALMNVARYAEALAEFDKVLEMNPKHVQAKLGHGLSNLELGNKAAALADLEASCKNGFKIACEKVKILGTKN